MKSNQTKPLPARRAIARLLVGALLLAIVACSGDRRKASEPNAFVVLFAGSGALVATATGQERPVKAGTLLRKGESITTRQGAVDLQSRIGSVVRIKAFTTMTVAALAGVDSANRLHVTNGTLLAKVRRRGRSEGFTVSTPTSIASVRGTTFQVSVQNGKQPVVKVHKGSVALKPRVSELDRIPAGQVKKNAGLKKLREELNKKEVVITAGTKGTLPKKLEKKTEAANAELRKARKAGKPAGKAVEKATQQLKSAPAIEKKTAKVTPREQADAQTLVDVEVQLINRLILQKEEAKTVVHAYKKKLNAAVKRVEKDLAKKTFKSEKEFRAYYDIEEIVTLRNGSKHRGAVVAQAGGILILHGRKGVRRVQREEVDYIDYVTDTTR